MKIRPLHDKIVVKRAKKETKSEGGIFLPEQTVKKPTKGTILSVGSGKILKDGSVLTPVVKEGDVVLFGEKTGYEVEVEGISVIIMREEDLMGIIV